MFVLSDRLDKFGRYAYFNTPASACPRRKSRAAADACPSRPPYGK